MKMQRYEHTAPIKGTVLTHRTEDGDWLRASDVDPILARVAALRLAAKTLIKNNYHLDLNGTHIECLECDADMERGVHDPKCDVGGLEHALVMLDALEEGGV